MKDTIVTARRKKTELITLLICFVVSNLLHLYAIIAYHAPLYGDDNVYFLYNYIYFCALCFLGDFASLVLWNASTV